MALSGLAAGPRFSESVVERAARAWLESKDLREFYLAAGR
jgi:hypothetical protein